ncbi:MAG: hypothetical protein ABSA92_01990 [Candidatus Bathyarchaeia archaeon]
MRKRQKKERVFIRLPKPLIDEVDEVVRVFPVAASNRQQFVEQSIRHFLLVHILPLAQGKRKRYSEL